MTLQQLKKRLVAPVYAPFVIPRNSHKFLLTRNRKRFAGFLFPSSSVEFHWQPRNKGEQVREKVREGEEGEGQKR